MAIFYKGTFETCKTMVYEDFDAAIFPLERARQCAKLSETDYFEDVYSSDTDYEFCQLFFEGILRYEGLWDGFKCTFGVKYYDEDEYYVGELEDLEPQGKGSYFGANGFFQSGEWKNGWLSGKSTIRYQNGKLFQGFWNDEDGVGNGISTWPNGDRYEGDYKDGVRSGRGYYKNHLGESYLGEWHNGYCHGEGESYDKDGNFYKGEWRYNCMEGKGDYQYSDGRSYNGSFKKDLKHGYGVYKWTDGDIYKGTWKYGKRDGKGIKIKGDIVKETIFVHNRKVSEKTIPNRRKGFRKN